MYTTLLHVVQDTAFKRAADRITGKLARKHKMLTDDHVLMSSYLITLQFFRTFRWDRAGKIWLNALQA